MKIETTFSPDRVYRYTLWREFNDMLTPKPGYVQFIGLNPSTADERIDDPTVRRCMNYTKAWGYGQFVMTNIFAFRSTDPTVMLKHRDPIGELNDHYLLKVAESAQLVICAWGNHGAHLYRAESVKNMLQRKFEIKLSRLGPLTNLGHPRHPLYLRSDLVPVDF